jgi:hypothetical protein
MLKTVKGTGAELSLVSVNFFLEASACFKSELNCKTVTLPFSWLMAKRCLRPYGEDKQHIKTFQPQSTEGLELIEKII